jgi:hypothetical protein
MSEVPGREPSVVVHKAGSPTEAIVIRGLLESAGIRPPEAAGADRLSTSEPHSGEASVEIEVRRSQANEARRIIADYLASEENIILDSPEDDSAGSSGGSPGE